MVDPDLGEDLGREGLVLDRGVISGLIRGGEIEIDRRKKTYIVICVIRRVRGVFFFFYIKHCGASRDWGKLALNAYARLYLIYKYSLL